MKFSRVILPLALILGGIHAAEPEKPEGGAPLPSTAPFPGPELRPGSNQKGLEGQGPAWLGFNVSKPDESTRAHLPELPAGMGFVIQSVEPKGPAERAGLRALDVVWKFGDQLLINESQLAVLLRMKHPGDVVSLALFRGGKAMDVDLTIGAYPINRPLPMGPVESVMMREEEGVITRIINLESRTASLKLDDGQAALKQIPDGKGYELQILDASGDVVFNGNLPPNCDVAAVPEAWRGRVKVLRRGLDNALGGGMESVRPPRPRVVPPLPQPEK
ncbi:MAG: PDZ domain-containing protein [Luteolibacter sp.]